MTAILVWSREGRGASIGFVFSVMVRRRRV
jgi:hypothetical protein